jgi:RES domain-containing protein
MFVYRVTNAKYKDFTLSGIGAEKVGGRWNRIGTRAVYCSENISLASLEYYVHSQNISYLPKEILVAKIKFPDSFVVEVLEKLPDFWNKYPYSSSTTQIFTQFAKDRNNFALKLPSSIVGLEDNIILNPLYKNFGRVKIVEFVSLPIDERLKKEER